MTDTHARALRLAAELQRILGDAEVRCSQGCTNAKDAVVFFGKVDGSHGRVKLYDNGEPDSYIFSGAWSEVEPLLLMKALIKAKERMDA